VRISRIQLSDHLFPAACAASQADGSLSLPFDTADTVYTGSDSSNASEPTAFACPGVYMGMAEPSSIIGLVTAGIGLLASVVSKK